MRLASDGSGVVFGMISAIVTARVLGPAGKGTLAALTFVTLLVGQCCVLGLGDAAVVRVGQAKASVQEALSSSLVAVLLASIGGAVAVLVYAILQLPLDNSGVRAAVGVACFTVIVSSVGQLLLFVVYATHRIVAVSVMTIAMSATTAAGIVVFCAALGLGILGAALASLVVATLGFGAGATMLHRAQLSLRPRASRVYLRPALAYGVRTQAANVLAYSSARLDLLFVYALASQREAGIYSVALTLGTITGFVAIGLSFASFPRMAGMTDHQALDLTAEMTRITALVGVALALLIAAVLSTLVKVLLGGDYRDVLAPAVVLLVANVLWGGQWLLSRALASRGEPRLLMRSFLLNLATMAAADAALIPLAGAMGAAFGTLLATTAGLLLCLKTYRDRGVPVSAFVPRRGDVLRLWTIGQRVALGVRQALP